MTVLIVCIFLGLITGFIAKSKGHSFGKWWFYGAALFIVALPMAIMLKPVGEDGSTSAHGGMRKCPKCAELIQPEAQVCRFCRAEVSPIPPEEQRKIKADADDAAKKAGYVPGWIVAVVIIGAILGAIAMANN